MKKELFYRSCHVVAGCILMYYAIGRIETRDFFNAGVCLAAGFIFLLVAGIHEWAEKMWSSADLLMFALEAITFFYVASRHYVADNRKLTSAFATAGVFFILVMVSSLAEKRRRRKKQKKKHRHEVRNPNSHTGYKGNERCR